MTPNNPTPSPPAHTAGRLTINEHGRVRTESGQPFRANGVAQTASNFDSPNLAEAEANTRRLVALWNACEALPTEALEAGAVAVLTREHPTPWVYVDDAIEDADGNRLLEPFQTSPQSVEALVWLINALAAVAQAEGREAQP